jgi:hypothetical protein
MVAHFMVDVLVLVPPDITTAAAAAVAAAAGCAQVLPMEPHLHSRADSQGSRAQVGA